MFYRLQHSFLALINFSAKLPLATVAMLLELFKEKLLIGFDIGCVFKTTLLNSSLGPKFKASGSRVCVNAFHGYSHSYPCQVQHHPNVIEGIGIEDLETLERTFSKSNKLASVIRFASAYCRRALIHMFFQQYDEEKYTATGSMLYNNYIQALEIICNLTPKLTEALRILNIDLNMLKQWEAEEAAYFKILRDEAQEDVFAVAYVEGLQELQALRYVANRPGSRVSLMPTFSILQGTAQSHEQSVFGPYPPRLSILHHNGAHRL